LIYNKESSKTIKKINMKTVMARKVNDSIKSDEEKGLEVIDLLNIRKSKDNLILTSMGALDPTRLVKALKRIIQ